jgi:type I restriction enzyme R subunit
MWALATSKTKQIPLSRIVDVINERFGTGFTPNDEIFSAQVREDAPADETARSAGEANSRDNFRPRV